MFLRHLRYLDGAQLPPLLKAQYLIHAGEGYARLGHAEEARSYLVEGMTVAAQYGYNHLTFQAEELLDKVSDTPAPTAVEPAMPGALAPIADAIRLRHTGVISLL